MGPFSTEDVKSQISRNMIADNHLIWGKEQSEWLGVKAWLKNSERQRPMSAAMHDPQIWHYAFEGASHGPLSRSELLQQVRKIKNIGSVSLWTKGMKSWAPIFDFQDITSELNINRRAHQRADIDGRVVVKWADQTAIGALRTISEGGCGVVEIPGLQPGQLVTLELQNKSFFAPVHARAEVRYIAGGFIGFRFEKLSMEARGAIIQYVKSVSVGQRAQSSAA